MTLTEADGKFTGNVEFPGARVLKITEGAVDGKKITFVVKRDRQDGGSMTYKSARGSGRRQDQRARPRTSRWADRCRRSTGRLRSE
jgi:hypothetical protein